MSTLLLSHVFITQLFPAAWSDLALLLILIWWTLIKQPNKQICAKACKGCQEWGETTSFLTRPTKAKYGKVLEQMRPCKEF